MQPSLGVTAMGSVVGLVLGLWLGPAHAVTLSLSTPALPVPVSGVASVELRISGLGDFAPESLGAFLVEVSFDDSLLGIAPTDIAYGTLLGDPDPLAFETDVVTVLGSGIVSLDLVSFLLNFELDALQPSGFTLATLSFTGLATGTGALGFGAIDFSNAEFPASTIVPNALETASVAVVAAPEPTTWGLLLVGLAVASRRVR